MVVVVVSLDTMVAVTAMTTTTGLEVVIPRLLCKWLW